MSDPHGLDLAPVLQTTLETAMVGTAMILLISCRPPVRNAALALLALAVIGRVAMQPIPNVQPVTVLVMLGAVRLGALRGASIGILAAYLSNLALGGGAWTVVQALSWAVIGSLTGIVVSRIEGRGFYLATLLAGLLYGALVSIPLGFEAWLHGLPFDLLHALGNITVAVWIVPFVDGALLHIGDWTIEEPWRNSRLDTSACSRALRPLR